MKSVRIVVWTYVPNDSKWQIIKARMILHWFSATHQDDGEGSEKGL